MCLLLNTKCFGIKLLHRRQTRKVQAWETITVGDCMAPSCGSTGFVAPLDSHWEPSNRAACLWIQQSCIYHSSIPCSVPGAKYTRSKECLQILSYFIRVTLTFVNIHLSKPRMPVDYEVIKLNLINKYCLSNIAQLDFREHGKGGGGGVGEDYLSGRWLSARTQPMSGGKTRLQFGLSRWPWD